MAPSAGIGVVGGRQRVFELAYPLTHLGDLTMQLLGVREDEAEGWLVGQPSWVGLGGWATHREP